MKRTLLIISILSIIFLTGCGAFSLNGWVCPDDPNFITMVEGLKTPQEMADYMEDNFYYEKHDLWTPDPYAFWKRGKGDCNDYATFGIFVADYHGYETYQIIISYSNASTRHMITIYVEDGGLSFTDNWRYFDKNGYFFNNFKGIVDYDCLLQSSPYRDWLKYIVYDYENNKIEEVYNIVH